jgi:hypothetical protein
MRSTTEPMALLLQNPPPPFTPEDVSSLSDKLFALAEQWEKAQRRNKELENERCSSEP